VAAPASAALVCSGSDMPFALAIIGILLVVAGARGMGNVKALRDLLVNDFTGQNNFLVLIFAIGLIGMVGYIPGMQKFSRAFLILLFVVLLLATRGGFLAQIKSAFQNAGGSAGTATGSSGSAIGNAVTGTLNGLGLTSPAPSQNAPSTATPQ
jgi:hypothetical protein